MREPHGRLIATKFNDSVCVRCGRHIEQGELCLHSRPFGVWCLDRCIPEFDEPNGDLGEVVAKLEKLEREERLKGFTKGLLDRYRLVGELSRMQIMCLMPTHEEKVVDW